MVRISSPWMVPPLAAALLVASWCGPARAQPKGPVQASGPGVLRAVKFDQNLDAPLPLDLTFRDESGTAVRLGDYFGKRPVILTLVYYGCPMLCTQVLNGLVSNLKILSFDIGGEFDIVTVSIHPSEGPALAAAKKRGYLKRYGRPRAAAGWHFLTGDQPAIERLARTVGFHYVYDPKTDQFAHPAGIMIATPQGRLARYFYGIDYPANSLRLGLIEASEGRIGSPVEKILLLCYHYDPATGKYNFVIMSALRLLGTATAMALGGYMGVMLYRDRRRGRGGVHQEHAEPAGP